MIEVIVIWFSVMLKRHFEFVAWCSRLWKTDEKTFLFLRQRWVFLLCGPIKQHPDYTNSVAPKTP